jgi:phage tail sheath protein FI
MQQYVFSPNNASTWAAVASSMSSILTTAWQQGTLMGPTAASAFTVSCQPNAQQILNGYLSCAVSMQLASGENYTTTLTQIMATSG